MSTGHVAAAAQIEESFGWMKTIGDATNFTPRPEEEGTETSVAMSYPVSVVLRRATASYSTKGRGQRAYTG